ncbi:phage tail tape measure protein [Marinobacter sp. G11]|uniref:phage tail tape measure protein n=1 Tax=Marinobacter sp. G11 TaxID=2903522 RepID=UPI001E35727C|nr:phage tail tape measure protein [Marinobacter sp. G11]MCE0760668.1 phage tail tape measure protein [Marinobacter sp. G11]
MADLKKTVDLIFNGTDKTGGAISSVGRGLDSLTDKVGSVTGPMASVTDSIIKLDAALAAAAIGITGYAIKISDDFQTAFAEIATIIGQPASELGEFQDALLAYSERSSQSLEQITSATYSAISAGVDYRESIDLIAAAEQLAVAGRADLGETTVGLVSVLNAFGASASEAGDYADSFFTAVKLGQTTIPELSASIGRLAPLAAAAGLDFDQMAAAIATITAETGTDTAAAITGIRAAITNILKPTKEATDLAAELGLEFSASALESKGFAGFLKDVGEATGGSTEQMARLFGSVQGLTLVLALTGNASEALARNLEAFEDKAGSAGNAADDLAADLSKITQTLQNNIDSALIAFAEDLTDETQSIVKSVTSIFNSMGDELRLEDGVFAPILAGMEGLAQGIDEKLKRIAENFPEALAGLDISGFMEAFGVLGSELEELLAGIFGDIDLDTVEGLQSAMQQVVDAFTALLNLSAGIANGLQPLFDAIGVGIDKFQDLDDATYKSIGEMLGLAKAIDTVLPAISGLAGGLESIGTGLTALAGAQGFKALIGNLNSVKAVAAGAGSLGLVGAALFGAGAVGYGIGTVINDKIIRPMEEAFGGSIGSWLYDQLNADELERIAQAFAPVSEAQRALKQDTQDLRDMNASLANMLNDTALATDETQQGWQDYADNLVEAANQQKETTQAIESSGGALDRVKTDTEKLAEANTSLTIGYDEATGKANSFSGTIVKTGKSLDDTAKKTEDAIKQSEAYQIKMLELASNEKIALIEGKVSLNIAEAEADAKKVEAIAQSISDSFQSTGDVISSLFSNDAPDWDRFGFETQKQLDRENERRQRAMDQQEKLNQAQIEYMKQRTKQMASGDAMIKIEGDGLAPHLEAFMFEVLRNIQTRVNQDGLDMLLGVDT